MGHPHQHRSVGLARRTHVVCSVLLVSVEVLLQDQFAVACNQQAMDVCRIAQRWRSGEDLLDQRGNATRIQTGVRQRANLPSIIFSDRNLIRVFGSRSWVESNGGVSVAT